MKKVDLFIGIKAEQNLREVVRIYGEQVSAADKEIELCPVGRKDWIAGMRFSGDLTQKEVEPLMQTVLRNLIALGSMQRIRSESIRLYSVQPPVPVFKDVEPEPEFPAETATDTTTTTTTTETKTEIEADEESTPSSDEPVTCPSCGRRVHPYNARYNLQNKMVGCSFCGGSV